MKFTIPVEPKAKQRARVISRGGKTISYTPGQTVKTETLIRSYLLQEKVYIDKGEPIHLEVTFNIVKPQSVGKKRVLPVTRPDIDNYLKLVLDACNKFLWADDSQITTLIAKKRYADKPSIEIEIITDS